jgi:hypothetical protein
VCWWGEGVVKFTTKREKEKKKVLNHKEKKNPEKRKGKRSQQFLSSHQEVLPNFCIENFSFKHLQMTD